MYSKHEASQLRETFWTALGQYMTPVLSSDGEMINWLNYRTGEKNIQFKLKADTRSASIGIEISHSDPGIQQLYYEQFLQLKNLLTQILGEEWTWGLHIPEENGKLVSRIYKELHDINLFNKQDWPTLISFFKPRLIALDQFWNEGKYFFESLGSWKSK
jgi:hypothetical protein